jgi:hypothetical protein
MNADRLTKAAIQTGLDASAWANIATQQELALARCAMHLYWCEDAAVLPEAAKTARDAIIRVMEHYANKSN